MSGDSFLDGRVTLRAGDCREWIRGYETGSFDAVVTDPPYALVSIGKRFGAAGAAAPKSGGATGVYARAAAGFMGQAWDTGETAFAAEFWAEVLRVLKPGGHVVAFAGTRTYHRLAVAIEDAGFEIRDQLAWVYGSGFPKSHDPGRQHDKALFGAAVDRDGGEALPQSHFGAHWAGWGSALKPAWEPIVLARKPLDGTLVETLRQHGCGALNVDGCRIVAEPMRRTSTGGMARKASPVFGQFSGEPAETRTASEGRWPANIVHDGSDDVVAAFPEESGGARQAKDGSKSGGLWSASTGMPAGPQYADAGSASRFFYSAKADAGDRIGSRHPTVKPVDLMQWLVRLVCPPGGRVLDPFAGTGTTGEAAWREGMRADLIEREAAYCTDIRRRLTVAGSPQARRAAVAVGRARGAEAEPLPLFGQGGGA